MTARTILHNTQLPLRSWLLAIWFVTTQGERSRAMDVQRLLGLSSYHTAWLAFRKISLILRHLDRSLDCSSVIGTLKVDSGVARSGSRRKPASPGEWVVGRNGEVALRWGLELKRECVPADEHHPWTAKYREWFSRSATLDHGRLFCRALKEAVQMPPTPYRRLIGSPIRAAAE